MKKWFILIGIFAVLLIGGYGILSFYAVKLIEPRLQKVTWPGLTLAEVKVKTTHLSAMNIRYQDPDSARNILEIEEVRVYPSLLSLLGKTLRIKEITILRPSLIYYRSQEGLVVGPIFASQKTKDREEVSGEARRRENKAAQEETEKKESESVSVQIDRIRIRRATVDFEDRKVGEPKAKFGLRDLDFEIENIRYPLTSSHSPIECKGNVKGEKQNGNIEMKGWVDLKTMDLETRLKIRAIEVEAFQPYYRKKVSAEIESGTMDMESQMVLKQKKIDASGELNFINLHIGEGKGTVFWIPAETLSSWLRKKGNHVKVPFHVKGDLEDPQFNLQEAFLSQVAFSLMEGLGLPFKSVGEMIGGKGKGLEGWVEGFKSIEEMFKKKKEKKR